MPELERLEIDGLVGTLAHFHRNFQLTDRAHAVYAKVVFDDGGEVLNSVSHPPDEAPAED